MAEITSAGLQVFYDDLLAAYGPQRWWPTQDTDNPRFEILVGAVLTQHTAWRNVEVAIATLCEAGPLTANSLLAHEHLATLIRRAGPHHVKAQRLRALCRWFFERGGFAGLEQDNTATLRSELLALRGIGRESADVILLYAFDRPMFVADAYAFRIMRRYGWADGPNGYERLRAAVEAAGPMHAPAFYHELHALIVAHARARCHKRRPDCGACVLAARCPRSGVERS